MNLRQPALPVFFCLLAGTWGGLAISGLDYGTFVVCALTLALIIWIWPLSASSALLCTGIFVAGAVRGAAVDPPALEMLSLDNSHAVLEGRVTGVYPKEGRVAVTIAVARVNRRPSRARASFFLNGTVVPEVWDDVKVSGRIDTGRMTFNLWKDGYENRPVDLREPELLSVDVTPCVGFMRPLALKVAKILKLSSGPAASNLMQQLLLGRVWTGERMNSEAYSGSGLIHILAVSGMHVSVLGVIGSAFISMFRPGPLSRALAILSILSLFSALTGFRPSVVRAAIMAGIAEAGKASGRPSDGLNLLGTAGSIMAAWNPLVVMELGFMLSFAATAALMTNLQPRRRRETNGFAVRVASGKMAAEGLDTFRVLALISPFLARLTGTLPLQSVLAGPVAAMLALGLLKTAVLISLTGFVSIDLSRAIGGFADLLASGLELTASGSAVYGFLNLSLPHPSPISLVGAYGLLALCLKAGVHRGSSGEVSAFRGGLLILAPWILIAAVEMPSQHSRPFISIQAIDCGQGSCILVTGPDGGNILIDTGPGKVHGPRGLGALLAEIGVKRLDCVFLTHFHDDHTGGLREISGMYETLVCGPGMAGHVKDIIDPSRPAPGIMEVSMGRRVIFSGMEMEILWPPADSAFSGPGKENGRSMAFSLREARQFCEYPPKVLSSNPCKAGDPVFMVTGDLEGAGLGIACDEFKGRFSCTTGPRVLSVPHHGSGNSILRPLYEMFDAAIIQRGRNNLHGHPSSEVLEALAEEEVEVFETASLGRVAFRLGNDGFRIGSQIPGASLSDAGEE